MTVLNTVWGHAERRRRSTYLATELATRGGGRLPRGPEHHKNAFFPRLLHGQTRTQCGGDSTKKT